jgi:hypothetical protein
MTGQLIMTRPPLYTPPLSGMMRGFSLSSSIARGLPQASNFPFIYPTDAILRAAGYILAIDYGADPTGVLDSTNALQAAIDAGLAASKPVWLHLGTYTISNHLRCYQWQRGTSFNNIWGGHNLHGASYNPATGLPARPKIKLAASAPNFDSVISYRPMLVLAVFIDTNGYSPPATEPTIPADLTFDPMTIPTGWFWGVGDAFMSSLFNIDFDTNNHAGAVGVDWSTCQNCHVQNVTVTSNNSWASFIGLPGTGSASVNISGAGGKFGAYLDVNRRGQSGMCSGGTIAGLSLTGHTVASIVPGDFCPMTIVGFNVAPAAGGVAWLPSSFASANGPQFATGVLQDGIVTQSSGLMFDNTGGLLLYLRNVYTTGGAQLVKSGSNAAITGSGTWTLINEYSACTQNAANNDGNGNGPFSSPSESLNAGTIITTLEQIVNTTVSSAAPPSDLVTRHYPATVPTIDNGPYIDATAAPYNAQSGGTSNLPTNLNQYWLYSFSTVGQPDSGPGIQAAIDAASAAGHGRVLLPYGVWWTGQTLNLHANTNLFGLSQPATLVLPHPNWVPTTGSPAVIQTDSNTEATTTLGFLNVCVPQAWGTLVGGIWTGNRFTHVLWRAGRKSVGYNVGFDIQTSQDNTGIVACNDKRILDFSGGGGGRWYSFCGPNSGQTQMNANYRYVRAAGSTQPLLIYGCNAEIDKGPSDTGPAPTAAIEINGAQNVRIWNLKREGHSPTILVRNGSSNVGVYGSGNLGANLNDANPIHAYGYVDNTSNNVLFAQWTFLFSQGIGNSNTLWDQTSGITIPQATQLATYKLGAINDALMSIA